MHVAELARKILARVRWHAAEIPYLVICFPAWRAAKRTLRQRPLVTEIELRAARRSDRVFIFGSGASLNEIEAGEWDRIQDHDTFGFNWFVHQDFTRVDFHLIRQIADSNDRAVWEPQTREYCEMLEGSSRFKDAILLVQHELRARGPNLALERGMFPRLHRVFPWRTHRGGESFTRSFSQGLTHGSSTLLDAINAAYLLGWRDIVLVGVDLYDRRYFWLPEGETRGVDRMRGAEYCDEHSQASTGLVDQLRAWGAELDVIGVRLSVHNPRSLLAGALPVFAWP